MYKHCVFSTQRGMSEIEEKGIRDILHLLKRPILWKLAKSISGAKRVTTKEKAINLILDGSRNSIEILKKKKVSCVVLRNYLLDNYIAVEKTDTKDELVKCTKLFWDMPQETRDKYLELIKQAQEKIQP